MNAIVENLDPALPALTQAIMAEMDETDAPLTNADMALLSIAASTNRIANALEKLTGGEVPYFLSESHFWQLGQAFGHGRGAAG
ncbi:hypothetical protein vBCbaSRXM_36 [Citromicrobium phage vB_CbaS-RXM]|nr:hypothetical protein vBCbaSRXM_36 [Citromicrobium phage vB_CbaS-RXM]